MTHIHTSYTRRILTALFTVSLVLSSQPGIAQAQSLFPWTIRLAQDHVETKPAPTFTVPSSRLDLAPDQYEWRVDATAYTSSPEETKPDDPFTTADGTHTHDGVLAANFLPFGTKVRLPDLFGDKIFEVHDRMNARFSDRSKYTPRVDVWMEKKPDMRQFGIHRKIRLEVVEMGDGSTQWHKRNQVAVQAN